VFIELADHLRCPADHPEAFLVLLPERMEGRQVREGLLGCPVCRAEYRIEGGLLSFGASAAISPPPGGTVPAAPALQALLGLEGPGGYVAIVGDAGEAAAGLGALLEGVHLVLVNPPPSVSAPPFASRVLAPRFPVKARSMRGVVVGWPESAEARWVMEAAGAALPGRHVIGRGPPPALPDLELLGSAEGWWVGRVVP
jgi:uncharacterized protein YbaR (Trm112 family)